MDQFLNDLKTFLLTLPPKKQIMFVDLLIYQLDLWKNENIFNYDNLPTYKFGDFIHLNLGINVGSEQGGKRYAVVVEDSPVKSKTVLIIPIHGEDNYREPKHHEVYIGKPITFLSKEHHYLNVSQLRSVSKMRIDNKYTKLSTETISDIKTILKRQFKLT